MSPALLPLSCLIVDDDPFAVQVLEKCVAGTDLLQLASTCSDAPEAARYLHATPVDVLLLDVDMPGMSGLELLATLTYRPQVVLVTSSTEYAVEAYALHATDYLVKPVSYARFLRAAQLVFDLHYRATASVVPADTATAVFVKVENRLVKVVYEEIRHVEALGGDVHVVLNTDTRLIVHGTLSDIENKFPGQQFLRIHRSTIVNLRHLQAIEENYAVVNGHLFPIGPAYLASVLARLHRL